MSLALNPSQRKDAHLQGGPWAPPSSSSLSEQETRNGREVRIAGAIADLARTEAACLGGSRLLRIGVNVGADCEIDLALLDEAFKVISKGTDIERVAIHFISRPRCNLCHRCGSEFSSRVAVKDCPKCFSSDLELVSGDELELAFIEVERA